MSDGASDALEWKVSERAGGAHARAAWHAHQANSIEGRHIRVVLGLAQKRILEFAGGWSQNVLASSWPGARPASTSS